MTSSAAATQRLELDVEGMTCSACVTRLERALNKAPGVADASVNLALERCSLQFDPSATNFDDVAGVIRRTGFHVGSTEKTFAIESPIGENDALRLREVLLNIPGVLGVEVQGAFESVAVSFANHIVEDSSLLGAAASAGYELESEEVEDTPSELLDSHGLRAT